MFGFKKKGAFDKMSFAQIIEVAEGFGINIPDLIDKKIPEGVAAARKMEAEAGARLFAAVSVSDDGQGFDFAIYRMLEGGQAEVWKAFQIRSGQQILDFLKFNDDATDTTNAGDAVTDNAAGYNPGATDAGAGNDEYPAGN